MKESKSVKTNLKQLLRLRHGSVETVANELHISTRYVEMLRDGARKASWSLAEIIRLKINMVI